MPTVAELRPGSTALSVTGGNPECLPRPDFTPEEFAKLSLEDRSIYDEMMEFWERNNDVCLLAWIEENGFLLEPVRRIGGLTEGRNSVH